MYEALIVEDEILVREGIKKCINWEENGFAMPKEAYNGSDAWSIIEASPVDVVITDIKMPGMNGIELIRKIRNSGKQIEIIMLSCYNDFNYVKEALELGACDYLFKLDMLPEDIVQALQRAVSRLSRKELTDSRIKMLEQTISQNLHISKAAYLLDIINGKKVSRDDFSKMSGELGIKLGTGSLFLAVIKIDGIDKVLERGVLGDEYVAKISMINTMLSCFEENENSEIVYKSSNEYVLIINVEKISSENKRYELCNGLLRNIINALEREYEIKVTAGACKRYRSIENLSLAYKEGSFAADKRFFAGTGKVLYFEDLGREKEIVEASEEIKEILRNISLSANEEAVEGIKKIFGLIKANSNYTIDTVVEISSYIMSILLKTVIKNEILIKELYANEPLIYSSLIKKNTVEDIENFLYKIASKIEELRAGLHRDDIGMALVYIENNLGKADLSLGEVAESVNLSKNYFSKVFKKSLGTNFIDYLTKARISSAEELYRSTKLKIYQIAGKVGYADWRYFCKLYKKQTGRKLTSLKR